MTKTKTTSDPKSEKRANDKKKLFTALALIIGLLAGAAIGLYIIMKPTATRLDDEYYGASEMLTLGSKDDYEQMLADKKSFVVMVDNPGCMTTAKMRDMMQNFPEDLQFKYYQFMWPEVMNSSLYDYVKHFPSAVIVDDGRVAAYLRADSDEDAKYYNSADDLAAWLRDHIEF